MVTNIYPIYDYYQNYFQICLIEAQMTLRRSPAMNGLNKGKHIHVFCAILDDQTQVDSKPAGQPEHAGLNQ